MKKIALFRLFLLFLISGCATLYIEFYWNDGIYTLSDTTSSLQFFICHQESDYDDATVSPIHLTIKESTNDSVLLSSRATSVDWDEKSERQSKEVHHFSGATFVIDSTVFSLKKLVIQSNSVQLYSSHEGKEIVHTLQHQKEYIQHDLEPGTYSTTIGGHTLSLIYKGDNNSNIRFVYLYGNTPATTNVGVDLWKTGLSVLSGDYVSLCYTYFNDEYTKSSETSNPKYFTFNGIRYSTIHLKMTPEGMLLQADSYGDNPPLTALLIKE